MNSEAREHLKGAPGWLSDPGDEYFRYDSRIYRSSKIMDMTSARDYASMWWVLPKWRKGRNFEKGYTDPVMEVHISRDPNGEESLNDSEQEPYGMKTMEASTDQPIAQLLQVADN
ncbi:hypothetical protein [Streptomyces sp. NPDC002889]|uniref:hypothetical protein n=1 Tax=Streptomyces sp. NPDC002889 TaxID=3364669 RepID=UPI0036B3B521